MANAWKMGSLRGPAGAGADVATSKKAGVVKPSGDFDITADGTLSLYTPMSVMSFTGGSDHEIGETVDTVNLAWKLNKTPATLTLDGQEIVKGADGNTITYGTSALAAGATGKAGDMYIQSNGDLYIFE